LKYYNEHINKLNNDIYSKEYLTKHIIQAKQYIDKHYTDKLNLNEIAEKAFISKFHFIRLFKSLYGVTPYQYLKAVRIDNAKQLLISQISISNVCSTVGFDSLTSFSTLFKKITGKTPYQFQKQKSNFE